MTDIRDTRRHNLVVEDDPTNRTVMARRLAIVAPGRPLFEPAPAPRVFDIGTLQGIVGDEPAVMMEVVASFDTVAVGIRAQLLRAASEADAAEAAMLAHTLKSSSRSVGALPLGALCQLLEEHGGAGRSVMVAPLVADVVDALDAALAAMRRWLGAQAPAVQQKTRYGT